MAELLIAAAEECKCNNQEKLMENDNSTTKDFTDTHNDNNRRSSHQGMFMCARVCACMLVYDC